jgi:hypothetical protein
LTPTPTANPNPQPQVLHYLAIAKAAGVDLNMEDFQRISDRVGGAGAGIGAGAPLGAVLGCDGMSPLANAWAGVRVKAPAGSSPALDSRSNAAAPNGARLQVPLIADLKPSGKYVMEDVHKVIFWFVLFVLCRYGAIQMTGAMLSCAVGPFFYRVPPTPPCHPAEPLHKGHCPHLTPTRPHPTRPHPTPPDPTPPHPTPTPP